MGKSAREAVVVIASALVVLGGAATAQRREPTPGAVTSAEGPGQPPPLPSGAPTLEALPSDDERAAGCHFAERGFGDYVAWRRPATGRASLPVRLLVPVGRAVADDGTFRLLMHFHGAEPVRKQLAPEGMGFVIAALDAGTGSRAYERALSDPGAFDQIIAAVEAEVAVANGLAKARARAVVLSSWSAGYGAVTQILSRRGPEGGADPRIAGVVLVDSLYAAYAHGNVVAHGQLPAFLDAARVARSGGAPFYLTHTAIATPGYASTAEVATFLLGELGVTAQGVDDGAGTAERFPLTRMYEEGHLWIRGYAGGDRDAHCAQLHLLPAILRDAILPSLNASSR